MTKSKSLAHGPAPVRYARIRNVRNEDRYSPDTVTRSGLAASRSWATLLARWAVEAGASSLEIREPEVNTLSSKWAVNTHFDGRILSGEQLVGVVEDIVSEVGLWCRLEAEDRFYLHFGQDDDCYVGASTTCPSSEGLARASYDVTAVPTSPYLIDRTLAHPYKAIDRAWWAECEALLGTGEAVLIVLEQWAYGIGGERWSALRTVDDLALLAARIAPRAAISLFIQPHMLPLRAARQVDPGARILWPADEPPFLAHADPADQDIGSIAGALTSTETLVFIPSQYSIDEVQLRVNPDSDGVVRSTMAF